MKNVLDEMSNLQIAEEARKAAARLTRRPGEEHGARLLTRLADRLDRLQSAVEPMSDLWDLIERNGYTKNPDLILRDDGRILGHAGITADNLREARAAATAGLKDKAEERRDDELSEM